MADIMADCNIDDTLSRHLTKHIFKYWTSYRNGGVRFLMRESHRPGAVSWVLETDEGDKLPNGDPGLSGKVVGWAQWHRIGTTPVARNWQKPAETWPSRFEAALQSIKNQYYDYVNPTNNRINSAEVMAVLQKPFDPDVFPEAWELSGLYVRQQYQRRGLAKIMLRWGLDQAAAERVPVVVKSSPAGIKTYEQASFRVLEKLELGFNPGGRGINKLVWEPTGMEGRWFDRAKRKIETPREKIAADDGPSTVVA